MSNKTKAQLLQEIEDLKQQITTLQNKIVVPIQGTNTGVKAPTQNNDNQHTSFIMAFDESIAIDLVKAYNPTFANSINTFIYVQQI